MRGPAPIRTTVVALAAGLVVAGCTSAGTPNPGASATTGDPSAGASSAAASPSADQAAGGTDSSGGGASPASGGSGDTGGHSSPRPAATSAASAPTIVYFRVRQKPSCPAGTTVNPIAGTPVSLEWQVTRADKVALSVDGPGVYGDGYAPTDSETLSFPCSGSEGDVQRHTYLLTVTNADGKRTRKIEVTATVHEVKPV